MKCVLNGGSQLINVPHVGVLRQVKWNISCSCLVLFFPLDIAQHFSYVLCTPLMHSLTGRISASQVVGFKSY